MNVDGWITIGTKLDNSELDNQYRKLLSKLKEKQKEGEQLAKIKVKIETDLQRYEREKKAIEEITNERLARTINDEEANQALITEERQLKELNAEYATQFERLEEINGQINNNVNSQEIIKQQIDQINQKVQNFKYFDDIKKSINGVGKSIRRVTKQVIHWGLAIFGVRSAYLFVRQAMSTLSSYDKQLATDLQYIRFVLASTLEPLIRKIVEWAYKLLSIIGSIIKLFTGYDIFKNSGVDKFQKSMAGSADSAKEIRKQLAGFDEMNVLSDNSGAGGGSGVDASGIPSMGLSSDVKLPKWMYDLKAYGKDIISIILGIVGAIKLLELGLKPIQAIGIGIAIAGITYAIISLLDYLKDPTWENFGGIIIGIGLAVAGLGIAFLSLPVAIAGVAIAIVGIIIQHWEEIKALFDKAVDWLYGIFKEVAEKYGWFAGLIVKGIIIIIESVRDSLDVIFTSIKTVFDNVIDFFRNAFAGKWEEAWLNLVNIVVNVFYAIMGAIGGILGSIRGLVITAFGVIGDVIGGIIKGAINAVFNYIETKINTAIGLFNNVLSFVNKLPGVDIKKIGYVSLPRLAKGGIVNMPSRGVPIGSAIAGERGAEGVIPLTDTQQMALLGEAIGKYITVHATIPVYAYNRQIDRQVKIIKAEDDFARNV